MKIQPLDEIAKTCIKILISEPFYGHFMMGLPKEMSEEVGTAAVAMYNRQLVKLIVSPVFWKSLSPDHRYGLIKHEVLHLVLKHLITSKNYPNKKLYNIAADLVVNQYIKLHQLPDGGLTLSRFAHLESMYGIKLLPNQDVGYYYRQLKKALASSPKMSFQQAVQKHSGNSKENPSGLPSGEDKGNGNGPINLTDILKDGHPELDRHDRWQEFDSLSEGERKVMEHQIDNIIKQTVQRVKHKSKNYGNLPGALVEMLNKILEEMKPQFNWRRLLRLFAASSNSTYLKNTIRRPSKRYGTTPGIKVKRRHRLLLAIDTSGSVVNEELLEFFSEIYFIWRQGVEIFVVECDTQIQSKYKYTGIPPNKIHGRGGTNFTEPIKFANDEFRPDAIIYFTDGEAPPPAIKSRHPILWVISSQGIKSGERSWSELPGKVLKIS